MNSTTQIDSIIRAIAARIPGAQLADVRVVVTETLSDGGENSWQGTPHGLATIIADALAANTEPPASPLSETDTAETSRYLPGEIRVLKEASTDLRAAPWWPLRPGDLIHIAMEQVGDIAAWGETYVIGQGTEHGQLWMRLLHHTPTDDPDLRGLAGAYAGPYDEPLYEAWFEAGPHRITVVRDGAVIPNQAAPAAQSTEV